MVNPARARPDVAAPGRPGGDRSPAARDLHLHSRGHAFPVPVDQRRPARRGRRDNAALAGRARSIRRPGAMARRSLRPAGMTALSCWAAGCQPGSGSLGGGVVLLGHARGDTPAVADLDALILRPRPDVRAALPAGRGPPGPAPRPPAHPAGVLDERRELPAERIGVLGAQVDLVVGA